MGLSNGCDEYGTASYEKQATGSKLRFTAVRILL
jgi:hypothetical protein